MSGLEPERHLTPPEVAEILRITKNTVYELVKRGELRSYKVGKKIRVKMSEVEAYRNRGSRALRPDSLRAQETQAEVSRGTAPHFAIAEVVKTGGFVLCGQDVLLDMLARRLEERLATERVYRSYMGSYNGLFALYQGQVSAATAHLWDGDTDSYNLPYLRHVLPGLPVRIIRLAGRTVGLYVAKGNPKGLRDWGDLTQPGLVMINRERGAGMRVLLDERLRLMKKSGSSIEGYGNEASNHLAVASVVARGGADFALGNEKVARQVAGIDFVPLQQEKYDLVFPLSCTGLAAFDALTEIAASAEFREELKGLGGYDTLETGAFIQ